MRRASPTVEAVVEPVVSGLGYQFVGAEFGQAENGQTLRIYIDSKGGVVVEDCVLVSRQLSAVMDVENVISSAYQLEVSSPGVDRPLFTPAQFTVQIGNIIKITMMVAVDGRRNFKGELLAVDQDNAIVLVDGIDYTLPVRDVEHANLVANLSRT